MAQEFRKYGTDPKLDKLVDSEDWKKRSNAAYKGYALEKLIDDKDPDVRAAVARQGYGLEQLVNDEDNWVRADVASQSYGLDKLQFDNDKDVRLTVALFCKDSILDNLCQDSSHIVRAAVATRGRLKDLDMLVDDKDVLVRSLVAEQGYGLDKLIFDEMEFIQDKAKFYLRNEQISLQDWIDRNPDKCALPENRKQAIVKEFKPKGLELPKQAKSQPNPGIGQR